MQATTRASPSSILRIPSRSRLPPKQIYWQSQLAVSTPVLSVSRAVFYSRVRILDGDSITRPRAPFCRESVWPTNGTIKQFFEVALVYLPDFSESAGVT